MTISPQSEIAVTIQPAAGTPPRNYTLIVEPILQERQRSDVLLTGTSVSLQVSTVSVVASPNSQEVQIGGSATYNLQINRNNFSNNASSNSVFNPPVLFEDAVVKFRVTNPLPTTPSEAIDIPILLGFDRN
jgi:hypothetical protein